MQVVVFFSSSMVSYNSLCNSCTLVRYLSSWALAYGIDVLWQVCTAIYCTISHEHCGDGENLHACLHFGCLGVTRVDKIWWLVPVCVVDIHPWLVSISSVFWSKWPSRHSWLLKCGWSSLTLSDACLSAISFHWMAHWFAILCRVIINGRNLNQIMSYR